MTLAETQVAQLLRLLWGMSQKITGPFTNPPEFNRISSNFSRNYTILVFHGRPRSWCHRPTSTLEHDVTSNHPKTGSPKHPEHPDPLHPPEWLF